MSTLDEIQHDLDNLIVRMERSNRSFRIQAGLIISAQILVALAALSYSIT